MRRKLEMRRMRNNYNHIFEMRQLELDAFIFIYMYPNWFQK